MHDTTAFPPAASRYPGYDVLTKWNGPSWNDKTRQVIAERLSISAEPRFFTPDQFKTVVAIAGRIVPQESEPFIPVAALLDDKLHRGVADGYRLATMPRDGEAWRLGIAALDAEATLAFGQRFAEISDENRDALLHRAGKGELNCAAWGSMRSSDFFQRRLLRDLVLAYYSHPAAWSDVGWGGPASPRGYVRLDYNDRDPWEAAEAKPGNQAAAFRINRHVR
jgi:hypothetical protein